MGQPDGMRGYAVRLARSEDAACSRPARPLLLLPGARGIPKTKDAGTSNFF